MKEAEKYFKKYGKLFQNVRKETYQKYEKETGMLFEFIDNWIELMPRDDKFYEMVNSISGIILINSWKLTNWITYEILIGKYFEAIRNLRFVFEGCIYAIILEDAIESRIYKKYKILSDILFKIDARA